MMSGFQVSNTAAAIVVDSNLPFTRKVAQYSRSAGNAGMYYNIANPWNGGFFGDMNVPVGTAGEKLIWARLTAGSSMFPSGGGLTGTIDVVECTKNAAAESGYLDVFNEVGALMWSAKSAGKSPQIAQIFAFGTGTPIDGQDYSVPFAASPFLLLNNFIGEISDDGEGSIGYSGLAVNWTGSALRFRWLNSNQTSFNAYAAQRGGMHIPAAKFTGL